MFKNKRVLITGGTGSLGKTLVKRLAYESPASITVFSRDEAKQWEMRQKIATEEIIYGEKGLRFVIGDVRDYQSVLNVVRDADIVINAAALKQVPSCEYHPFEAVQTNILGAQNIVRATQRSHVETVVFISTDKSPHAVNVMGMTKAIQERIFIAANLNSSTRFVGVRYGNVLASRGSVIPLFHNQIRRGGPVTVTDARMTRFLITLESAVDIVFEAVRSAWPGETYIPHIPSVLMVDLARCLAGNIEIKETGIRPGEKLHEILISEEEARRTYKRGKYFVVRPLLPEIDNNKHLDGLCESNPMYEYSSEDYLMTVKQIECLLRDNKLRVEDAEAGELLR